MLLMAEATCRLLHTCYQASIHEDGWHHPHLKYLNSGHDRWIFHQKHQLQQRCLNQPKGWWQRSTQISQKNCHWHWIVVGRSMLSLLFLKALRLLAFLFAPFFPTSKIFKTCRSASSVNPTIPANSRYLVTHWPFMAVSHGRLRALLPLRHKSRVLLMTAFTCHQGVARKNDQYLKFNTTQTKKVTASWLSSRRRWGGTSLRSP